MTQRSSAPRHADKRQRLQASSLKQRHTRRIRRLMKGWQGPRRRRGRRWLRHASLIIIDHKAIAIRHTAKARMLNHSMKLLTQAQARRIKGWGHAYGRQGCGRRLFSHSPGHALCVREREIEAIHKWTKAVHSMQLPTQAQAWRRKSWGWAYGRQVSGRRLLSHPFGHALPKAERDRGRDDRDRDIHAPFLAKNRLTARALS